MSKLFAADVVDILKPRERVESVVRESKTEVIGFAPSTESAPALRPFRPDGRLIKSELPGVSDNDWTDFVFAMKVGQRSSISPSNGLGMFDMRYKRLADFKLVSNLRYERDPQTNRSVQIADWTGSLTRVDPATNQPVQTAKSREEFLASAADQYDVFVRSMRAYAREIVTHKIKVPSGVSMSGALAILHRGGRAALAKWTEQQFESTKELFNRTNGVF